ncbi:MAG TPA: hypothetical protein ENJ79_09135 [Gammaproteobacteria bacterium]|nr:hypothetical protein [Gammaproteobacteria bacterium]
MAEPLSRIFLLSHMRAFTSLAGHILGSHPRINGYFEMHLAYEHAAALDEQLGLFTQREPIKPGSRYLFDKLLHNAYRLGPEALCGVELRLLVSLARPERTLKSIVSLFRQNDPEHDWASPEGAVRYYVGRLQYLARFCKSSTVPFLYYDAELLREAAPRWLSGVSEWLELDSPLSERYRTFARTGEARCGDSSPAIRAGRVLAGTSDYSDVHLPVEVCGQAQEAYQAFRPQIVAHAAVVLDLVD